MTDDKTLEKAERKRLQVENAPKKSAEAALVKLADKLYNLQDLQRSIPDGWNEKRVKEYFQWAKLVTDALGKGHNAILENELQEIYTAKGDN